MGDLRKEDFEKVIFFAFKKAKEKGKEVVLGDELNAELQIRIGKYFPELSQSEWEALKTTINKLIDEKVIRYEDMRGRLGGRFMKGINFENWYSQMEGNRTETQSLQVNISAHTINNSPVAVGGRDVHQQVTSDIEELVRILEKLVKEPEKGEEVINKAKESINLGKIKTVAELVEYIISIARSLGF
ncbi:hypothetical protein [Thermovibrio sp.]